MPSSGKNGAGWSARLTSSRATSIAPKTWRRPALERAWRHWSEVSSYERPAAWARRVLLNLAVNRHKRLSREEPLDEHDQVDREHEDHLALVEALRTLSSTHQQALVLHHGVGLSVAEVASELHAPVGT
jgi:DNA-directed RNA polymerase specialized sigma24 family protein